MCVHFKANTGRIKRFIYIFNARAIKAQNKTDSRRSYYFVESSIRRRIIIIIITVKMRVFANLF